MGFDKRGKWRSEEYRRLVALLPCAACGIYGYSQAAHGGMKYGKGGAMKATDAAIAALCGPRTGEPGCHADFDSGAMVPKAEREAWFDHVAMKTVVALIETGLLTVSERGKNAIEHKEFRTSYSS